MPHRVYDSLATVAGLLTVAALLAARADLEHHARSGPRWKRRLVRVGLPILATLGLVAPTASCSRANGGAQSGAATAQPPPTATSTPTVQIQPAPPATSVPTASASYAQTAEWKQMEQITREAREIAAGKKGQYPFDEAGKRRILDGLERAGQNADALSAAGHLNDGEARLLKLDLGLLSRQVADFRPTEMRNATCYEPMPMPVPAREASERLSKRLPLLETLAAAKTIHPAVVEKVLKKIEADLEVLIKPSELETWKAQGGDAKKARALADEVRKQIEQIRSRLPETAGSNQP